VRIRNRYLLELLLTIARLGRQDVSAALLVEAWKEQGRVVDDAFFLHYEMLFDYRFVNRLEQPPDADEPADQLLTMTTDGANFLERYYT